MPTVQNLTVTTSGGIGKPDYSNEISMGRVRPGISLKYGETLGVVGIAFSNIPSFYPWVDTPLAAGATTPLIDWSTGLPLPLTTAVGYTYSMIQFTYVMSEDVSMPVYLDTIFMTYLVAAGSGGNVVYMASVIGMGTELFDPTGATAHLFNIQITNEGLAAMTGAISLYNITAEVGTPPPPTTKTVKCKWCGHLTEGVLKGTNSVTCSECGQITLYIDLTHVREL